MSIHALSETIDELPYNLSQQVLSYARALEIAAPEIFKDAGVKPNPELTNTLVFIAGLRKLFSIVDANYWVVENTGAILASQQEQYSVRVGSTDISRGGTYHQSLNTVRSELTKILAEHQLLQYVDNVPYVEILRELADGH